MHAAPQTLITGASGFIGQHLLDRLAGSGGVSAVDRRPAAALPEGVDFQLVDVLDPAWAPSITGGATIIHLAGASGSRDATAEQCQRDNVDATVRVAHLAADSGARLIVASSSSVYGGPPPNREDGPCTPLNHYGVSKLEAERLALEITGGAALALRFFTVYGPGQRANMLFSRAIRAATSEETLTVHDANATRDFTYVDEVVRAIELAIHNPDASGVMNIGAGETHSVAEALEMIETATGRTIEYVIGDSGVAEPHQTQADVMRAAEQLGFRNEISLKQGIERQVAAQTLLASQQ